MPLLCGLRTGGSPAASRSVEQTGTSGRRCTPSRYRLAIAPAWRAVDHRSASPRFPASSRGYHRRCTRSGSRPSRWPRDHSSPGRRLRSIWLRPRSGTQSRPSTNAYRWFAPQYGLRADAARRAVFVDRFSSGCRCSPHWITQRARVWRGISTP